MLSKEFANESYKLYYGVAKGYELVDIKNFSEVFKLLPDTETMMQDKNRFAESIINILKSNDEALQFKESDYAKFSENPEEFRGVKVITNSSSEANLKEGKELMMLINEMYGHYSVSIRIINFLVDRCNVNINLNKELLKKYNEALNKLSGYENLKKSLPYNIGELNKVQTNPLILTEEETKKLENTNNVEEKETDEEPIEKGFKENEPVEEEVEFNEPETEEK